MLNFFAKVFGYILYGIYFVCKNYGLAIIIFSFLLKLIMLPLSIKQQKTLKKNEKLQKEIKIIQVKHKGNTEKINQEIMELYKREKINPFSGCLSGIIQIILIISMFILVKSPLTFMTKVDKTSIDNQIETLKMENYSVSAQYPEMSIIKYLKDNGKTESNMYINMDFLGLDLSEVPQENYKDIKVFIIPVLYVISSIISIKFTTMSTKKKVDDEGNKDKNSNDEKEFDQAEMTEQMNKNMSLMMPILSVSISLVAPLGLALYWLVNNLIMIAERLILNKIISKEDNENA